MNIKSLLLGSAAALAVVSGAQAADAVVAAEPEPMEYVRVCDAYGTGFFYIPGTETCLKVGGELRFEKNYGKAEGRNIYGQKNRASYNWHTRARLNIEARNDSEWGTVYSWLRLQNDNTNNVQSTNAYYYFGIGGLEFGNFDRASVRFHGYGGRTDWGGDYGWMPERQYVSYTATFDGISAFVALENDMVSGSNIDYIKTTPAGVPVGYRYNQDDGGNKYMPDVSAALKGTFGDYEAGAMVSYDESAESFNVRKWVRGDIGMFGFTLMGLYSDDARNSFFAYDGFSGILGLSAKVTDTVTVSKDIQWWDDDSWRVIGDVNWEVASGFSVLLEASYGDGAQVGNKVKTGMLRFQRSF